MRSPRNSNTFPFRGEKERAFRNKENDRFRMGTNMGRLRGRTLNLRPSSCHCWVDASDLMSSDCSLEVIKSRREGLVMWSYAGMNERSTLVIRLESRRDGRLVRDVHDRSRSRGRGISRRIEADVNVAQRSGRLAGLRQPRTYLCSTEEILVPPTWLCFTTR